MPTQMQYYNSSPSVTGILQPHNAPALVRPRDVYPAATVPRIRPSTGFQFRDVSPPRGKPVWNDSRKTEEFTNSLRRYRYTLNHRPVESPLSKRAPFAARTMSASSGGYRYKNGHVDTLPSYSPMNDPHLYDYYAKKFGLQVNGQPSTLRRANSAPPTRLGHRPGSAAAQKVLYKVVVKTGEKKRCGTSARVYIQMKGTKGKVNKTQLSKKSTSSQEFKFTKGSTHTFKVYGPEIGDIKNITLEHDGLEQQHAWYVDEVFITNTNRDKTWHFPCRRWFSLYNADCQLSRTLTPSIKASQHQLDGKVGDHTVVIKQDKLRQKEMFLSALRVIVR